MLQRTLILALAIVSVVSAESASRIVAKVGQPIAFTCETSSPLLPLHYLYWRTFDAPDASLEQMRSVFWSNEPSQLSERYHLKDNYALEIKNVELDDSAYFECLIVNMKTLATISTKRTFLSVIDEPECWASSLAGMPGDVVTLTCQPRVRDSIEIGSGADAAMAIRWHSAVSGEFESTQPTIHVNLSESLNDAVFTCTTQLGGVATTCVLDPFDVKFAPQQPSIFVSLWPHTGGPGIELSTTNFTVSIHTKNFSMTCHSRGNPEPKVAWFFGSTQLANETLIFPEIKMTHIGLYRCEAIGALNGINYRLTRELYLGVTKNRPQALVQPNMSLGMIIGSSVAGLLATGALTFLVCWAVRYRRSGVSPQGNRRFFPLTSNVTRRSWMSLVRNGGKKSLAVNLGDNSSDISGDKDKNVMVMVDGDDALTTPLKIGGTTGCSTSSGASSASEDSVGEPVSGGGVTNSLALNGKSASNGGDMA